MAKIEAASPEPITFAFLAHLDRNLLVRIGLMRALVLQGHEVFALSPEGSCTSIFASLGIKHHPIYFSRAGISPIRQVRTLASIFSALCRIRPQCLHTATLIPNILGGIAARLSGVPVFVAAVTGVGSLYAHRPDSGASRALRALVDIVYAFALGRATIVFFLNPTDADDFCELGIVPRGKAHLIPGEGVDVELFTPVRLRTGSEARPVVVTMIARLIADKGIHEFADAARTLKLAFGNQIDIRLLGVRDSANPTSRRFGILEELQRKGVLSLLQPRPDVRPLLAETDIYVLPSYREGLSLSILEAMSMGLPVVTTDVPGCRDAVVDGLNGFLVPPGAADKLANAISRLVLDPALRTRMGEAGRIRAVTGFSVTSATRSQLSALSKLFSSVASDLDGVNLFPEGFNPLEAAFHKSGAGSLESGGIK